MLAVLSLSTIGLTFSPNIGIVKLVHLQRNSQKNNTINLKQKHSLRSCKAGIEVPEDTANDGPKLHSVKAFAASQKSVLRSESGIGLKANAENLRRRLSYLFRTEHGGLVKVFVEVNNSMYSVHIEVSSLPHTLGQQDLILSWGIFRDDSSHLSVPDFQSPVLDMDNITSKGHGSVKTPFTQNSLGMHTITLEFDSTQAPFYLSFLLQSAPNHATTDSGIRTHRKTKFVVPVGISSGSPLPLGVSTSKDGSLNFALFSRNAERVVLSLYESNSNRPCLEIELDSYVNRTGDIWHVSMETSGKYVSYGYRCRGEISWEKGGRFHARQVLLDPYAKLIGNFFPDQGELVSLAKCLGQLDQAPSFDWSGDVHPELPMEKLIVYRLNVENFTKDKSSAVSEDVAGTFTGVIEKLDHLKSLGVNAVLLEPIFSFDEQRGPYLPYHFFSPMSKYGCKRDGMSAITSMREMVKALHAHNIEVLLEVVFTNTSEGGDATCQTISFRGIDNSSYYIVEGGAGSGHNNAVKCYNPVVQQLILDSLRYWRTEFRVDGFCFINSSHLLRGSNGDHLSRPPLVEAIAFDPLLSKAKIISDCWFPAEMSYVDVHFPHWKRWAEMNTKFCRDVRNFLRGKGLLSDLATRLCGSGDVFSDSRGPAFSFNYITKNVGLPLVDLVSFSGDEFPSELSWNCGEEGPTDDISVLQIRARQIRNFLFVLFATLGIPVLNMGDECGVSTGGLLSYDDRRPIDWSGAKTVFGKEIIQFISFLSSLRVRRGDLFQKREYLKVENIGWHGSNQSPPEWENPSCRFLAMILIAENDDELAGHDKGDLFICFNASDLPETVILPQLPEGYAWFRLVDTSLPFPGFFSRDPVAVEASSAYELKPYSCALYEAEKRES